MNGYMRHHTGMWEVFLLKNSRKELNTATVHNLLSQETKPELSRYYHAELFSLTKTSLMRDIKNDF